MNVFSSMLFGGISGSAVADVSALGSIFIPVMKENGYGEDYAANATVTSSIAGIIVGGVLSGIFTVTESGAFGAIYAVLVTVLVSRSLTLEGFRLAVVRAVLRTTAMVIVLIACASFCPWWPA